ncbi:hypothetical protein ACQ4PT_010903 [Festuca glaucescens]
MPGPGLEDGLSVVEAATAGTSKVAPFFGDDGGGVSEAEGRAAGCRPGLEPGVDVVDTNKVAPFVRGQDDEGASQVDGSFTGRREARGGVMAPALDLSTNKMEPFSSSDAVGDTSGSGGGSYARRCDDRVTPSFDPQLPNATERTVTVLENRSAVTEDFTSKQQATSMSPGSSMPESMGKLSPITEIILSWKLKDIMDDNLYRDKIKSHCNLCNNQSDLTDTASNYLTLSKSQLAIAKSLSLAVQCTHKNVLKMVIGPPRSGKTRILVAILHLLYQFDFRVLVCVPQKTGTFQLWKTLEASGYPINDIIVLDSLKGIRLPKKFHQTCLHTKSREFRTCLVMARQWIEEMKMLLQLMVYCPSSCNHVPKDGRCSHSGLPLFTRKLYRKAFLPLAIDLRKCLIELTEKYSKMYLPNNNKTDIGIVLNLLEAFENLLFNETPSEEHIQRAFGYLPPLPIAEKLIQVTSGSFGHALAKQMNDARLKFANLLQNFGKSLVVPKFGNIKEAECYCIAHSRVVIGTPQSIFQLYAMKIKSINVLVVDDAAKVKESDLIVSLCISLKHVLLFGDIRTSPPMVKSKVCYEAGFHTSLFQRLLKSKNIPRIKLDEQFVNSRFYSGKIESGSNVSCAAYSQNFANLEFTNYCFIDITDEDKNSDCIEIAGILYMLHILRNCWEDVDKNLHIAIVCFPSSPVYAMKDGLISKYAGDKKIKLSVIYADSIDGQMYDVVIISAFFKNGDQIDLKAVTAAITRARYCFWFLGDLSACPGTLGELVDDARDHNYLMKLDPKKLQMVNDLGDFPSSNNDSLMVGVESTWNGRPYRSKYILAPMRNQGNSDTCTLHSSLATTESQYKFEYARQEPPREFDWILCTCDLNKKYKAVVDKEIGDEVIDNRGSKRLETLHNILENPGVLGRKRLQPEVTDIFNVKSCSKLEIKENEDMRIALATLDAGSVLAGNYRVSRNYFSLNPGEVYHYDSKMPYLSPRSSLPYAHAVMMIGSGTEVRKVHLNFQNSAGSLFGDNGFGKVGSSSVRGLHIIRV